jgi:hypothetical protein
MVTNGIIAVYCTIIIHGLTKLHDDATVIELREF